MHRSGRRSALCPAVTFLTGPVTYAYAFAVQPLPELCAQAHASPAHLTVLCIERVQTQPHLSVIEGNTSPRHTKPNLMETLMKTFAIAAVIALGAAAPTFAQSQLEQSLGADAGQYTVGQLAQLKTQSTEDSANDRNTFFGNSRINFSASNIHNGTASDIFDRLTAESLDDN